MPRADNPETGKTGFAQAATLTHMPPKTLPPHHNPDSAVGEPRQFAIASYVVPVARARPGLYLVATPIGNLGDITLRALETLAGVDAVACEDTRITHRLMERFAIRTALTPYHEHNAAIARPKLLARLAQGEAIALVSDAGTPLISDPGFKLVREASLAGHTIIALPGPSSVLAALAVGALPTDRFFFEGFLPSKQNARRTRLTELSHIDATLVLFEAGTRVQETLKDVVAILGQRDGAVCRELTKLHEEVNRGTLAELAAQADTLETRGEFVLVIGPPSKDAERMSADALDELLIASLAQHSVKDAVAHAVTLSGRPKRVVYARALELSSRGKAHDDGE